MILIVLALVVLQYKSANLTQNDVDTLKDMGWISDQVINFYNEYLMNENKAKDKVILMDPASVSLIIHTADIDDLFEVFTPLNLDKAELIC